jgi:thioredoxin-like negative regulator of GroEL
MSLAEELETLKHARELLRSGDHQGALRALDAYTNELRGSNLGAEATMLRIEALAAAGRRDEAAGLAQRFVLQNPDSPLVDRARAYVNSVAPRESSSAP